jgi:NAD(P)-dependent dehydrogenase (short-subunit alcohol dehydrogenase family)
MKNNNLNLPKFSLWSRNAVITGGAGLLGIEHARAILEAGGSVILWDIDSKGLDFAIRKLKSEFASSKVYGSIVDVTSETEIICGLESLEANNVEVSILINNAAINPKYNDSKIVSTRLEHFSASDWNHEISVGLTSAFLCSKIFGGQMARKGGGVIVNIASDLSVIAPDQRLYKNPSISDEDQAVKPVTYSVIKNGLIGLTKYLATYWNESGVRVNALSPGGVYDGQNSEFVAKLTELIPLGRMANSDEYRSAIQFLCSDASSYMTGQNLVIDGGRTVW